MYIIKNDAVMKDDGEEDMIQVVKRESKIKHEEAWITFKTSINYCNSKICCIY